MKSLPLALVAAFASTACATVPPADSVESISFETGPCFGACPVYRVTVNSEGGGTFEGRRFTAVTGTRSFRATPEQFRAFAARLAPLRPASGERRLTGDACEMMATDQPTTDVTWRSAASEQKFYFYYGCDMEKNRPIAERLDAAPGLLPIGEFIRNPE
jgi:hypothetical protein